MSHFIANFKKLYPFPIGGWREAISVFVIGLLVIALILINSYLSLTIWHPTRNTAFILACGIAAILSGSLYRIYIPKLLHKWFAESNWTVALQVIYELVYFICIGSALLGVAVAMKVANLEPVQLLIFVGATTVFGVIPLSIKVLVSQNRLLKKNLSEMQRLMSYPEDSLNDLESKSANNGNVILTASTNDSLTINPQDILFVEADKSYCEIKWVDAGEIKNYLMRQNIGALLEQLKDFNIVHCHRSYLVNLTNVEGVVGNAQGYQLKITGLDQRVPLSRGKAKMVLPKLSLPHNQ